MLHQNTIKSLKKDLKKDMQKSRLDNLLLHTSTLLGIILALFQTMINQEYVIKCFIPLFLFVWLIPVYIGYVKGAIAYDLISERLRGWMYLIEGTLAYLLFLGVFFLRTKTDKNISIIDNYIILLLLLSIVFIGDFTYRKFIKLFKTKISVVEKYLIRRTIFHPIFLGFASLLLLILMDIKINKIEDLIDVGFLVGLGLIVSIVILVIFTEMRNKKIIEARDRHPKLIDKNLITLDSSILIISFLASIVTIILNNYVFKNFIVMFIFIFVVALIGNILLFRLLFYNKKVVFD
jgi:hypothetical protein